MRVDLFDFELPSECIALRPAVPRDMAKLLCIDGDFSGHQVHDLPQLLRAGDALVFNDTKVFPAQLSGMRVRGENMAAVILNLHRRLGEDSWRAFARPAKKLQAGDHIHFEKFSTEVIAREEAEVVLQFSLTGAELDRAIAAHGAMPLPPYIASKRKPDARDVEDYQTMFAEYDGSVAAPTAGLHFTPKLIESLKKNGIGIHFVTLHVGAGTFLPVKSETTEEHVMHTEWGSVPEETANALNDVRKEGGRIVPVGTTSLRLLESASDDSGIKAFSGETSIFITPGYRFRAADAMLTNFHLPRSTLFMLVCAFAGLETMQAAYGYAIKNNYRFYSYGDACLLYPKRTV